MAGFLGRMCDKMEAKIFQLSEESEDDSDVHCTYCSRKVRLLSFRHLNPGDHISMGGENLKRNFGKKQVTFYSHHAIVKRVEHATHSSAIVTLIEFTPTAFDSNAQIRETTELKSLRHDEIYVIKYRHTPFTPEEILANAEKTKAENSKKYKLFTFNCEHFCRSCCTGEKDSIQVEALKTAINAIISAVTHVVNAVGRFAGKILDKLLKLILLSVDDIALLKSLSATKVSWGILFPIMAVLYLIYCRYKHKDLNKKLKNNEICGNCCRREQQDIWIKYVVYVASQAGGLAMLTAISASVIGSVGIVAVCGILTLGLFWVIPKLRATLRSPFEGRRVKMKTLSSVREGDVISFDHWKVPHEGVVSAIEMHEDSKDQRGKIKLIHYKPIVKGKRVVVEEELEVDISKQRILHYDYSKYTTHEPDAVVWRARQRIGETKHSWISNRSCHFCHWAKVHEDDVDELEIVPSDEPPLVFARTFHEPDDMTEEDKKHMKASAVMQDQRRGKKHATKTLDKIPAWIRDDIKVGQIICFKVNGFWHSAVTTAVDYSCPSQSEVKLTVVHYGSKGTVVEEERTLDLNKKDIEIYRYHPIYRYDTAAVIRRARAKVGEKKFNAFTRRSSHLAKEILEKDYNTLIKDLDEIQPGDVITFVHWSLEHDGIVTKVSNDGAKGNNKGTISVVHYALDTLFATRTITEETMSVDLSKQNVILKSYTSYVVYPNDRVVKRAKSRIGEQRFSIHGNTSWDFVHWAKVVQAAAIVKTTDDRERLFMPNTDQPVMKKHTNFQIHRAFGWEDMRPGTMIEYKYYLKWHTGIISECDETEHEIHVIHYGKHNLLATRTIMEDVLRVDVQHDDLWVYRPDATKSYKPTEVVKRAKKRLGETKHGSENRSLNFCKWCVIVDAEKPTTADDIVPSDEPTPVFSRSIHHPKDMPEDVTIMAEDTEHAKTIIDPVLFDQRRIKYHAGNTVDKFPARIREDIEVGEIISFTVNGSWHNAVTTAVDYSCPSQSEVKLTVVHYGSKETVVEEELTFDLNHEDIWIYRYHPTYRYDAAAVIRRAKAKVGEGKCNAFTRGMYYLVKDIVETECDILVKHLYEIQPGDAITFPHWKLKHRGIVTEVTNDGANGNNKGTISVVHYALNTLFDPRTITEETMSVDLRKQNIFLKSYTSYVVYPNDRVVERARSRIGEQRFSIGRNTSCDFVHWAKVVQAAAIVKTTDDRERLLMPNTNQLAWVIPTNFQIHQAFCWEDMRPGTMIEYKYYLKWHTGIISECHKSEKTIHVIHYGRDSLLATRTIMETVMRVDLQHDDLWMYIPDHPKSRTPTDIVKKAKERLGEQKYGRKNRSMDFCKACILDDDKKTTT